VLVTMTVRVSGGGERVVAEPGQDVMGLAEDLAGLGQRGALAVAPVFDLGVIGVVRGRGPGVGLAGLINRPAPSARPDACHLMIGDAVTEESNRRDAEPVNLYAAHTTRRQKRPLLPM